MNEAFYLFKKVILEVQLTIQLIQDIQRGENNYHHHDEYTYSI